MVSVDERLRWPYWPELLETRPASTFVAQGTLVNRESLEATIGDTDLGGPAIVRGVRRIFNFELLEDNFVENGGRYERSADPSRRATLNIVDTGRHEDTVNGILFRTSPHDVDALARRESGYDLLEVDYDQRPHGPRGQAYMFIARRGSAAGGRRVRDDILPNESAVTTGLTGAASFGADFVEAWIESCLMADGSRLRDDPYYSDLISDRLRSLLR